MGNLASLQSGFWSLRTGVRAQPGRGPEAATLLVPRGRRGETPYTSSAAILFSPEFTPHLSGGTPLPGAYLDDNFRGLEVLLFRPGPVRSSGAPR
ncbi:hypothetical protein NDU88_002055 [Pleurodeles waltl]|uniref:Uncharacterized protein n=1 Tax=Pleurodeles waltl TaxID=8319 RepID=A0AAV7WNW2_PLEWA|nr:hypothetical protein NDU88_002055 [Pleurodeles waltl]